MKMASGLEETIFGETKKKMIGFGQGAWIGNFGEDGVRARGNFFHSEDQKEIVEFGQGVRIGSFDEDGVRAKETFLHLEKQKT